VLAALLMAVRRNDPKAEVIGHSEQGSRFRSGYWRAFLKTQGLVASMSRRGAAKTMSWPRASSNGSSASGSGVEST
jgi:hypothetical protein